MKIDGKKVAEEIIQSLHKKARKLEEGGVAPKIAIITLGEEDSWKTYVRQKIKLAKALDIEVTLLKLESLPETEVEKIIFNLNEDPTTHGIIVQRPLPEMYDEQRIVQAVKKEKDIDGFRNNSHFTPPIFQAVEEILRRADLKITELKNKQIAVVGKGVTGGLPIIKELEKKDMKPQVITSKTKNKDELLKKADILISATGKESIDAQSIKNGVVLIGIGIRRQRGKLKGDFDEEKIQSKAKFYTPTPGGVGPINLAFLFKNLLNAAETN